MKVEFQMINVCSSKQKVANETEGYAGEKEGEYLKRTRLVTQHDSKESIRLEGVDTT